MNMLILRVVINIVEVLSQTLAKFDRIKSRAQRDCHTLQFVTQPLLISNSVRIFFFVDRLEYASNTKESGLQLALRNQCHKPLTLTTCCL